MPSRVIIYIYKLIYFLLNIKKFIIIYNNFSYLKIIEKLTVIGGKYRYFPPCSTLIKAIFTS